MFTMVEEAVAAVLVVCVTVDIAAPASCVSDVGRRVWRCIAADVLRAKSRLS